jgi:peroxiredoxin
MSKSTRLILLAVVFSLGCAVLVAMEYRKVAAVLGLLGYFLSIFSVKAGASKWKVLISLPIAAIFGFALCPPDGLFCMLACAVLFMSIGCVRLIFFEQLGHTRMGWIEPVLFLGGVTYYVVGNLFDGSGWLSWTLPAPGAAFAGFMLMGRVVEGKELSRGAIAKFAVEIGQPAPDFALPDQEGKTVQLSDYKGKRHVLLIFVRGDWCPTCHIMLRSYEKNKEHFAAKNIMLLGIGPDNVEVNKVMVEKLGLDYKLLSDEKLEAAKAYGMQVHGNNPMTKYAEGIPLPASFLVDINGNVLYTSNPKNAGEILNPETIIPVVDKLHAPALV